MGYFVGYFFLCGLLFRSPEIISRHAAAPCGMHFVVALPGAWFAPAGSPAKKARREMGAVSSAGGGWRVVYARWIVVGTVHWCLAAIAAPTGSPNPAPTFRGYRGLNGVLSCRWVGSGLRRLEWLWCVLVGACFLTGRGAAVAALLVGVSASVRAGT